MIEWITAYCREDGVTYTIKGHEEAGMFVAMGTNIPRAKVRVLPYECDTLEDVAELARQIREERIGRLLEGEN